MRAVGKFIWRFMVIFSFIVNLVLVFVLIGLLLFIFDIKNNIAQPLVTGLHSSFIGLDQATIDWTIPVRDSINLDLVIPLETRTTVVLASAIPLTVDATINLNGQIVPVDVALSLPAGTELDVFLDLDVLVQQPVPVNLDVRAVIPLSQTQLHDPLNNLQLMFEPLAVGLTNLPNNFGEAGQMVSNVLSGNPPNLLAPNAYTAQPWPGFSQTAGFNYQFFAEPLPSQNARIQTNIVPIGGIPALDEQIRPGVYQQGGPTQVNAQAYGTLQQQGIDPAYFNGTMGQYWQQQQAQNAQQPVVDAQTATGGSEQSPTGQSNDDLGFITPTPVP